VASRLPALCQNVLGNRSASYLEPVTAGAPLSHTLKSGSRILHFADNTLAPDLTQGKQSIVEREAMPATFPISVLLQKLDPAGQALSAPRQATGC
jgi:hypothetical protein